MFCKLAPAAYSFRNRQMPKLDCGCAARLVPKADRSARPGQGREGAGWAVFAQGFRVCLFV